MLPISLMLASDYKIRVRGVDQSLSGRPDATILIEIAVYAAVAAFLVLMLAGPPAWRRTTPLLFAAWGFALTLAISASWSSQQALAMVRGLQLLVVCGLCQAISKHATRDHLHWFGHGFVVVVAISVFLGVAFQLPRPQRLVSRFTWLYVHPVLAGTYLALAVVLLIGYLTLRRRPGFGPAWPPWVYGSLLALTAAALLATRTRGAIGACALGCLVLAMGFSTPKRRVDLIVILLALGVLIAVLFGQQIVDFLQRGESTEQISTFNSRTALWDIALDLFSQRPLFGYGLTASRGAFLDALALGGAHNGFVNVLVDAGLVGALWWLALLGLLARTILR
ncbi:MAG: O-antigen ligase family protein, partial [Actinomycetota bacterium]|nr:O-antigen ligase family protein [Actinomycetota bacterium]